MANWRMIQGNKSIQVQIYVFPLQRLVRIFIKVCDFLFSYSILFCVPNLILIHFLRRTLNVHASLNLAKLMFLLLTADEVLLYSLLWDLHIRDKRFSTGQQGQDQFRPNHLRLTLVVFFYQIWTRSNQNKGWGVGNPPNKYLYNSENSGTMLSRVVEQERQFIFIKILKNFSLFL